MATTMSLRKPTRCGTQRAKLFQTSMPLLLSGRSTCLTACLSPGRGRRHSSIGYPSPIDYERRHYALAIDRPPGGRKMRPSLTAAARDDRTIVRVGTEEWLRRGPNQRMARHVRATCRQIRSANSKLSPLNETGASPEEKRVTCGRGMKTRNRNSLTNERAIAAVSLRDWGEEV